MKQLNANSVGIDQGSRILFSDFEEGGVMWTGEGPREARFPTEFGKAYKTPPAVHVSLTMWDTDGKTNQRADLKAENITETSFEIVFKTWGDSRVARVRADWMSIGELSNEDDWQLY